MASALYNKFKEALLAASGPIDLDADTIRVSLGRVSAYTFSQTHDFKDDVATVVNADAALGSKTVTDGVFDAADALFTAVGAGAALDFALVWKDTGVASTSPVIAYFDGFTVTPNGGNITIVWDNGANKIFKL